MPAFPFIYLASQSPRRAQLLDQLGVAYRTLLPHPGADAQQSEALEALEALEAMHPGESAEVYVQRVTRLKLDAALKRLRARLVRPPQGELPALNVPVLCADTTVELNGVIMGKPESRLHAVDMLNALSGKTHRVLTALCLSQPSGSAEHSDTQLGTQLGTQRSESFVDAEPLCALSESWVEFAVLSAAQIQAYTKTGEPMGKAGAYAVQGRAGAFIKSIQGSYSGIMGLPLFECAQLLARLGVSL